MEGDIVSLSEAPRSINQLSRTFSIYLKLQQFLTDDVRPVFWTPEPNDLAEDGVQQFTSEIVPNVASQISRGGCGEIALYLN